MPVEYSARSSFKRKGSLKQASVDRCLSARVEVDLHVPLSKERLLVPKWLQYRMMNPIDRFYRTERNPKDRFQ